MHFGEEKKIMKDWVDVLIGTVSGNYKLYKYEAKI